MKSVVENSAPIQMTLNRDHTFQQPLSSTKRASRGRKRTRAPRSRSRATKRRKK